MKSIEVNVPRRIITKFRVHPELYGDFIVELDNGMCTDCYYDESGDFITITNDEQLISYLKSQKVKPYNYLFQNGMIAIREFEQEDIGILKKWKTDYNEKNIRIITYCWIEIGILKQAEHMIYNDIVYRDFTIEILNNILKEFES